MLCAWLMPKKAIKVFAVLDDVFVNMTPSEAKTLWIFLTALRGPDFEFSTTLKEWTTGAIRQNLFPKLAHLIHSDTMSLGVLPTFTSINDESDFNTMLRVIDKASKENYHMHFIRHVVDAINAHPKLAEGFKKAKDRSSFAQLDREAEEVKD